jgi:TonB family protein
MYCPACGAANVDGAKFCGACGARLEAPAPVAPVAVAPTTADTAATVVRPPLVDDASLMPRSRGRRRVVAVVAIDLALVIGGLVLWTRSPTTAPASPRTGGAGSAGAVAVTGDPDAGKGDGASAGGGGSGGAAATGPSRPTGGGGGSPGGGSPGGGSSGGGGPGTGSAAVPGAVDARSLDDLLTDAGPGPVPTVDAAALEPGAPDASSAVEPPAQDAAVAAPELADAATADPADADDGEVSAQVVEQQFNRLAVASESKLGRCYQTATKALPDDQPIVGEVDIALAVMPTGKTENVRVEANTTGSQTLANCALGVVQAWSFSPHTAAGPLVFSRKFRFGPGQ